MILHCELSKAASLVEWRRGKELLQHGDKYQVRKKELQVEVKILDLRASDSGEYSCVCGEQTTRASVTVKGELLCTFCLRCSTFVVSYCCLYLTFLGFFQSGPSNSSKN